MNVEPTKPSRTKRAGASAAPAGKLPSSAQDDSLAGLPMSLWLRGDEAYFEEFSLDADAVMAELNIRRSRLTQISGKELRVARKRVGRYITPMYRKTDVDAYKAWTRPTATHQKSADAIKEATTLLGAQTAELARSHQELAKASKKALLAAVSELAKQGEANHAAITSIIRAMQTELRTPEPAQRHALLLTRVDVLAGLIQQQNSEQQSQWNVVREVLARALANQQSLDARLKQTEQNLAAVFSEQLESAQSRLAATMRAELAVLRKAPRRKPTTKNTPHQRPTGHTPKVKRKSGSVVRP
jgi:hypothetical protein